MKITPVELRGLEFKKVLRGADPKEVKFYIEHTADELEHLLLENKKLNEQLEQYKKLESTIREEAIRAQEALKSQQEDAKKEAELIIEKAKAEAEKLKDELVHLKQERDNFVAQFKEVLNSYLSSLEKEPLLKSAKSLIHTDIEAESPASQDIGKGDDIKAEPEDKESPDSQESSLEEEQELLLSPPEEPESPVHTDLETESKSGAPTGSGLLEKPEPSESQKAEEDKKNL